MPSWLGNVIAVSFVILLTGISIREIRKGHKSGSCGSCSGNCSACSHTCSRQSGSPSVKQTDEKAIVKTVLSIEGMMCGMCEAHINQAIRNAFPVKTVKSSYKKGECVILSALPLSQEDLKKVINETCYTLTKIAQS